MRQIIGPFAVAQHVGPRHLDLDDDDIPPRVERHQVGASPTLQRDFGNGNQVVAEQHPRDPARDISGA